MVFAIATGSSRFPVVRPWEMIEVAFVENDMGKKAVAPLPLEQQPNLPVGLYGVEVQIASSDKPGIPVPLVRVQMLRRPCAALGAISELLTSWKLK